MVSTRRWAWDNSRRERRGSFVARVEELLKAYTRFVGYDWKERVAPEERVWFGLYDPAEERRMRFRIGAFEEATIGRTVRPVDVLARVP